MLLQPFWDTKDHVFRFNIQELCPLIEEFAAIPGCSLDSTAMIALLDLDMQLPNKLVTFSDMPPDDIYLYLFLSGTMNLSSLIATCETKDKNSVVWIRTVSFCLYTQFLLVSYYDDADTKTISVLKQVEA